MSDLQGNVYDPLGEGYNDLKKGLVKFVGDPVERIKEDHLRILRYYRFYALYSSSVPDKDAIDACKKESEKIYRLSRERISQEFYKILSSDKAMRVLKLMFEHGVLKKLCFPETNLKFLGQVCDFQARYGLSQVASRLYVLSGLQKENINFMEESIIVPKVFLKDIDAIEGVLNLDDLKNEHAVKVAVYKYGRVSAAQALMIELAQDRVMNGFAKNALDVIQKWEVPNFPVSGDDLIKKGYTAGPDLGKELARLENEWIEGGFK